MNIVIVVVILVTSSIIITIITIFAAPAAAAAAAAAAVVDVAAVVVVDNTIFNITVAVQRGTRANKAEVLAVCVLAMYCPQVAQDKVEVHSI